MQSLLQLLYALSQFLLGSLMSSLLQPHNFTIQFGHMGRYLNSYPYKLNAFLISFISCVMLASTIVFILEMIIPVTFLDSVEIIKIVIIPFSIFTLYQIISQYLMNLMHYRCTLHLILPGCK